MPEKLQQYHKQARALEERTATILDERIRRALLSAAERWREVAEQIERCER
jgi:flagellar biosynthesis/type III secretory pathway chaperone